MYFVIYRLSVLMG